MKTLPLGDLSLDTFLTEYWQKKPLLVRDAFPAIQPPISAEELAGLACEDVVESRLVVQDEASDRWELTHGPFSDETFRTLPKTHWTLLVQAVDHWVPEAADFLELFSFIPSWRVDDLMISYSSDGGGVGPHFDNYDVFLVQVGGKRMWEIGGIYDEQSPRRSDTPVMILTDWAPEQRWTLEPGDLLYIPPRIGHNGVAVGDACMTCSVGFRAPSHRDLLVEFAHDIGAHLPDEVRYTDPDLAPQSNPGLITPEVLQRVHRILRRYVDNSTMLAEWFGRYMTQPKYPTYDEEEPHEDTYSIEEIRRHGQAGGILKRNEGSRFAFQEQESETWLFVDGRCYFCRDTQRELIQHLCAVRTILPEIYLKTEGHLALLVDLLNHGSLYVPE